MVRAPLLPVTLALTVLVLAAPLLTGCGRPEAGEAAAGPAPVVVTVAEAVPAPGASLVRGTGTVAYKRELPLSFKVSGRIAAISVDVADSVRKGARLALLDQEEVSAQLREAEAAVTRAQQDLDRLEPLLEKGFVELSRIETARTSLQAAKARRDAVAFNRSLSEITAPADGVVLSRPVEPGEIVPAGAPVLTLGDRGSGLIVRVGLADRDIGRIAPGNAAEVLLDGRSLPATVDRIAAKSSPGTGVFDVELALDAVPERLASGRIVGVRIVPVAGADAGLLAIPSSAILEGFGMEATVYVLDPETGRVSRRMLTVAGLDGPFTLIAGGLAPGEQVATTGAAYLRPGDPVTVAGPQTATIDR